MKIILLILLSICTILNAEYRRYKPRVPPSRRHSAPSQQFAKKWHQGGPLIQGIPQGLSQGPPQGMHQGLPLGMPQGIPLRGPPARQRPINHTPMLLAAPNHKVPVKVPLGLPQMGQRPVTPPVRNGWKNPSSNVKFPPEMNYRPHNPSPQAQVEQQKPFRAAPSLPVQEYDYHIQTNQIPQNINPIKQIGEKGPIHTIPAPNLSLKDKPPTIEHIRNDLTYQRNNPYELNYQQNPSNKVRNEISYSQNIPQSTYVTIQKSKEYQVTEPPENNQKLYKAQQDHQKQIQLQIQKQIEKMQKQNAQLEAQNQQQNPSGDIILSNNLSPKDLYQLVSATYPQAQQNQQIENINLFQPENTFIDQYPHKSTSDKASFSPEYHSFNYDEQAHQKSLSKKGMSSLVSATYNLGVDPKEASSRNSADVSAQSELVQNYFDSRSDVVENKIEPDVKSSSKKDSAKDTLVGTSYYSSLPNKEAAERLAQLQSAGKINSNLMKLTGHEDSKEPLTILIPDENKGERNDKKSDERDQSDYDDYSQEDIASEESMEYGHRIQPKKRAE